ncbi:peptidase-like protein [Paraglaciecola sp. T6c]|uniref:PKD domain-containing protein n=1 Tax=Pseudoalteromonas atlantica (strain T6c / ATCC BAA-1087) TaxID=3042615 RepID=UPI00005C59F8|nr:pre-peptidase C-terminal domain-containing protein [Paraglaciecola sp. T6c]ABG40023.1 peptidase-like protein [Paraglaciecola sp. T6c]
MDTRNVTYNKRGPDAHIEHASDSLSNRASNSILPRSLQHYWLVLCGLLMLCMGASQVQAADLVNGGSVSGVISVAGEEDTWTFNATAGERINIQLVDLAAGDLFPQMTLYAPDGTRVTSASNYTVASIYNAEAPETGTYSLVVQDGTSRQDNTGAYALHFAKSIGANENGSLINGSSVSGDITLGDLDTWTFDAIEGERLNIQLVDVDEAGFFPLMILYAPDGSRVGSASNYTVANLYNVAATQTGTYILLVQDGTSRREQVGSYEVHFAKSVGANENGTLNNGGVVSSDIALGDLDTWTFEATAGERLNIQIADVNEGDFFPFMTIYGPDGTRVGSASNYTVANLYNVAATQTGTYILLVQDGTSRREQVGNYEVHFAKSIGANENGTLNNGGAVSSDITLGDLDTWTFEATTGERLNIQIADVDDAGFFPFMTLYAPDGTRVGSASNYTVANLYNVAATQTGTYILLVQDGTSRRDEVGSYEVHFAKSVGANENGPLINGGAVSSDITLGDLDTWTFEATAGENLNIQIADVDNTGFFPFMTLYAPDGTRVGSASNYTVANLYNVSATQTGTFTLLVQDGTSRRDQVGNYEVHFAKSVGANENGPLINGGVVSSDITLGDLDTWTFEAVAGERLHIQLSDILRNVYFPLMTLYAPDGSRVSNASNYSVANLRNILATQTGTYILLVQDGTGRRDQTSDYEIHFAKSLGANEHGKLSGAGSYFETVTQGDIDTFTFDGVVGDEVTLVMRELEVTNLSPFITLHNPDGSYFTNASHYSEAGVYNLSLPMNGTYTIVLSDGTSGRDQIGDYVLEYNLPTAAPDPQKPIASASSAPTLFKDQVIQLNGSGSFDPDEAPEALTYSWTLVSAPDSSAVAQADIAEPNSANASVQPDVYGEYRFELTVSDGLLSDSAIVTVTVINRAPSAHAGADQNVELNVPTQLDGSASNDADGDLLTYAWTVVSVPSGSAVTALQNSTSVNPSFTPDVAGDYVFTLVVDDGEDSSIGDSVVVRVAQANVAPQADIQVSGDMLTGTQVALDGSASVDNDNGPQALTYEWQVISAPAGSTINTASLVSQGTATTSFTADVAGTYRVQLAVFDGELTDVVEASIVINEVVVNQGPVADAGADQQQELGDSVEVNASASFDPDQSPAPLTFEWVFVSVPQGSLLVSASIESTPAGLAMFVPDVAGTYTLMVTVSDSELTDSDSVMVTVSENQIPVADAGSDQTVDAGERVALDGSLSYDPDSGPQALSYLWEVASRPENSVATVINNNNVLAFIEPDLAGLYTLRLVVSDGQATDEDEVLIDVINVVQPRMCDVDGNDFVDSLDIRAIARLRNATASEGDVADWDQNGVINVLDARGCALECDLSRCALKPE